MSGARLSGAAQVRYMVQWFEEWSELQRQDFLPLLAHKLARPARGLDAVTAALAAVNCHAKPLSLFQCRIKLFNEWYPTWGEEERSRLVQGISSIDPDFGTKLQHQLDSTQTAVNGFANGNVDHEAEAHLEPHMTADDLVQSEDTTPETQPETAEQERSENIAAETLQEPAVPLEIAATS